MILYSDIRAAIGRELKKQYPNGKMYTDKMPNQFERPSFFIEFVTDSRNLVNVSTESVTAYFTVTCYLQRNEFGQSGEAALADELQKISRLFSLGYLQVNDRSPKIKASNGGQDGDKAYIDIQLEWQEENGREQPVLPDVKEVITSIDQK